MRTYTRSRRISPCTGAQEARVKKAEEKEQTAKVSVLAARASQSEAEAEEQSGKNLCAWEPALTHPSRCTPSRHARWTGTHKWGWGVMER